MLSRGFRTSAEQF